jgi:NADH-quinone oxidoreductase subunit F
MDKTFRINVLVCAGTSCVSGGSLEVRDAFIEEVKKRGMENEVKVETSGCNGFCAQGPLTVVYPEGIFYRQLKPGDVPHIVEEHFIKGRVAKKFVFEEHERKTLIPKMMDIGFFRDQVLVALRNRGLINPDNIDEYIARDGYAAAAKALTEMNSDDIIKTMIDSGLRGRGGAGFPTGLKWKFCAAAQGDVKYMLCNADEGDPGAFMDRSVLEADPHAVLEGMIIGGKAIGSHKGYIYVRAEYPLAIERLNTAIRQAKDYGLLGDDILETGFSFDIELYHGAGAFVCGEETALMRSIEGKRGMPRPRPPFPAHKGLWNRPSVLNNVETLANISQIILKGAEWFSGLGTEKSKGTKVFAVSGCINNIGLIEVPMGIPLRTIIYEICGGAQDPNHKLKAAQLGGPSGGCVPERMWDIPVDYESITKTGAIMGSGGMVVMDDTSCMVDVAKYFLGFTVEESCGKCTPCRVGNVMLLEKLTDISEGRGKPGDLEYLQDLSKYIIDSSLCGLGQTSPNPVLTTIKYFREEYEAHIHEKRCPAEVCKRLMPAPCQKSCPLGQDASGYVAMISAQKFKEALDVIRADNPLPSVCGRLCIHGCETSCRRGKDVDEPISIKALKRFVADSEMEYLKQSVKSVPVVYDKKIAVIGSGPTGLAAAYDLAKMGYPVTIFEAEPVAGGLLRTAIPEFRMPRAMLEAEIRAIETMGVEIKTNSPIGGEQGLSQLAGQGYKAIFIATGAAQASCRALPGSEGNDGVIDFMKFLKEVNSSGGKKPGDRVIVTGTGHAAIDVARLCARLGSSEVSVVSRRSRSELHYDEEEISQTENEGVSFHFQMIPKEVVGENGKVSGLKCTRAGLTEPDPRGRRRAVPTDEEVVLKADVIIPTQGRRPDTSFIKDEDGIKLSVRNLITVDEKSLQTTKAGVFAGGEVVSGPATVVEVMAAGKAAARSIDRYLRGKKPLHAGFRPRPRVTIPQVELTDKEAQGLKRVVMPARPVKKGSLDFKEVETGLVPEKAVLEAKRCLRCDL